MSKVFLRTMYNYDTDSVSDETAIGGFEPTLTVQSEAENCDINVILKRFGQGVPPPINNRPPLDTDWDQVTSFQSAMELVVQARTSFMEVPADIRARFNNDPQKFLEFIYNDSNYDEALKLGLIEARPDAEVAPSGASSVNGEQGEAPPSA